MQSLRSSFLLFVFCLSSLGGLLACGAESQEREIEFTPSEEEENAIATEIVPGEGACTTDADCSPSVCCHADSCVAAADAPSCRDVVCTTDFRFGTIDGGGCLCVDGQCAAEVSAVPN